MLGALGLAILGLLGGLLIGFGLPFDLLGVTDPQVLALLTPGSVAVIIVAILVIGLRERAGLILRQMSLCVAVVLTGSSVFVHRAELLALGTEYAGDMLPTVLVAEEKPPAEDYSRQRVIAIRANENGQFDVDTLINGTHVSMLADTGATYVTLTDEDARRSGIDVKALEYNVKLRTANGETRAALVNIDELTVGGIVVRDVKAIVSQPDVLHVSLLGMSYFSEIGSFELSGDQLVLRR